MKYQELIASLTIEDAVRYSNVTDKIIWIEYNLLDPNDLPRRLAESVEDVLIGLLEAKDSK